MFPIPKSFFLTRGMGTHKERLTAFELALRDADIEQQNLVTVSSILSPGCGEIERGDAHIRKPRIQPLKTAVHGAFAKDGYLVSLFADHLDLLCRFLA